MNLWQWGLVVLIAPLLMLLFGNGLIAALLAAKGIMLVVLAVSFLGAALTLFQAAKTAPAVLSGLWGLVSAPKKGGMR